MSQGSIRHQGFGLESAKTNRQKNLTPKGGFQIANANIKHSKIALFCRSLVSKPRSLDFRSNFEKIGLGFTLLKPGFGVARLPYEIVPKMAYVKKSHKSASEMRSLVPNLRSPNQIWSNLALGQKCRKAASKL